MTERNQRQRSWLPPFIWVGAAWGLLGSMLCILFGAEIPQSVAWWLAIWAACMLDLLTLSRAVAAFIDFMTSKDDARHSALGVQLAFWGAAKILCLGGIVVLLFWAKNASGLSLTLGAGTLLVVPLVAGFWRTHEELKYA